MRSAKDTAGDRPEPKPVVPQAVPEGALFFFWGPVSWGSGEGVRHMGFVEGIDALEQSVFTCEGNTDGSGTREGGGVYRLERGLQTVHEFGVYGD